MERAGEEQMALRRTPPVRRLSADLCNQIAAGEVLERPASAVKELVENSLDAGARWISVELEEGGRALLRVTDDGHGMTRADAEVALERHATSKIAQLSDLDAISTLGFRGEALASMASVAKMKLVTQLHDAEVGTEIVIHGAELKHIRDTAAAAGTSIELRELFFNTPARLKFLKRAASELRRIQTWMQRLALIRHDVHFRLIHDGKKRLDVGPHQDPRDRIRSILGKDAAAALYPLPELPPVDGVSTRGFFSEPSYTVRGSVGQYVFVNGRFIKDRTISAAIVSAYRELLGKGRQPAVVLYLDVPFDMVDVNVHPTKIEVRFSDNDAVFRSVYRGLRDGLSTAPWATDDEVLNRAGLPLTRRVPGPNESNSATESVQGVLNAVYGPRPQLSSPDSPALRPNGSTAVARISPSAPGSGSAAVPGDRYFSRLRYIGQYLRAYLLASDNQGLVVVDQHAAHERISFERLKLAYADKAPQTQHLLFPMQIEVDALRAATLEEQLEFFTRVGFEIEPFGGQTFALKAVPAMLVGASYDRVIKDALDDLSNFERTSRMTEAIEAVLSRMACHGSVRAGDDLTEEEAYALFQQMDAIDFRGNCPHGRPVYFQMTLEELEKRFDRR